MRIGDLIVQSDILKGKAKTLVEAIDEKIGALREKAFSQATEAKLQAIEGVKGSAWAAVKREFQTRSAPLLAKNEKETASKRDQEALVPLRDYVAFLENTNKQLKDIDWIDRDLILPIQLTPRKDKPTPIEKTGNFFRRLFSPSERSSSPSSQGDSSASSFVEV